MIDLWPAVKGIAEELNKKSVGQGCHARQSFTRKGQALIGVIEFGGQLEFKGCVTSHTHDLLHNYIM
jgi:hypothetical protein